MEVCYDRSKRPLEFWAAVLSATRHSHALSEYDLEATMGIAMGYLHESSSPAEKSLSLYVLGRAILLMREHYPDWSEWVACAAILSGEWAYDAGDAVQMLRSEALFAEYIRLQKR